jgi:hypothetical protein
MSDPVSQVPTARPPWLSAWWYLGGLALGLIALGVAGRRIARLDYHPGFVRFPPPVSPESSYYPTLHEMEAIVRGQCRPDQILVIVGGNSILLGVYQPPADVWSKHLQELLGDRYCVVNLAFRGAGPANGGAVVAEALRDEFPRTIYIADEAALTATTSLGYWPYRYLTWEAYFGGSLIDYPPRNATIAEYRSHDQAQRKELTDAAISALFDRVLYYKDVWNWVTFWHVCTVPSLYGASIPDLLTPRSQIPDIEPDATDPAIATYTGDPKIELQIARGSLTYVSRQPDGHWELAPPTRDDLISRFNETFPPQLRARTLLLIARSSPLYVRKMTADEQAGYDEAFRLTDVIWRQEGYSAIDFGRDFEVADYGDRSHLSKFGGVKLAALVAPQVRTMAEQLGYLR